MADVRQVVGPRSLCVELENGVHSVVTVDESTVAKQVLEMLLIKSEVLALYGYQACRRMDNFQLVPAVATALGENAMPLRADEAVITLGHVGHWKTTTRALVPLVVLKKASEVVPSSTPQIAAGLRPSNYPPQDSLIDGGAAPNWCSNDEEAMFFRAEFDAADYEIIDGNSGPQFHYPQFVSTGQDMPPCDANNKFRMLVHLPGKVISQTQVACNGETTVKDLMGIVVRKYQQREEVQLDSEKYMFKMKGFRDYQYTWHYPLYAYDYIRSAVKKSLTPELVLIPRPEELMIPTIPPPMEPPPPPPILSDPTPDSLQNRPQHQGVSVRTIDLPFRVAVKGLQGLRAADGSVYTNVYVEVSLYLGSCLLGSVGGGKMTTSVLSAPGAAPRWRGWLTSRVKYCQLPRAVRASFTVYGNTTSAKSKKEADVGSQVIGWVNCRLFDHRRRLKSGLLRMGLWTDQTTEDPTGTCLDNDKSTAPAIFLQLDSFPSPIYFPEDAENVPTVTKGTVEERLVDEESEAKRISAVDLMDLARIISKDPLHILTVPEKRLLLAHRKYILFNPKALSKYLSAVDWADVEAVKEVYRSLQLWETPNYIDAMELLDGRFADVRVRSYAVTCMEAMPDSELEEYMLQLVQALKYEPYHSSALAMFLLRRAVRKPHQIGHLFFWQLRAEMHSTLIQERYGLLLEQYLKRCGAHRNELSVQDMLLKKLLKAAYLMHDKTIKKEDKLRVLHESLEKINESLVRPFTIVLSPRMQGSRIIVEKCKSMRSKKKPLWLVFENADEDAAPIYLMFKAGDDLRQDILTLQMFRIMDRMWLSNGLDLKMRPYGCIATGDGVGMLEIVLNSDTLANIHKWAGGATAAFSEKPVHNWLKQFNKDDALPAVVENFIQSCAGYSVATYVLGIGDRHNDNIMLTKTGHVFHIDFGHFLGHFKSKFGIRRERAPFVFTPDFCYVMGGKGSDGFENFINQSIKAYNLLRKHSHMFINLFSLMLCTGIPELTRPDLEYLRQTLALDSNDDATPVTDDDAASRFRALVHSSLKTTMTQINYAIHILAN
eukprot:GILK01006272.1.p1 GENE.GILK01006272.1~~GILK01006272.1.p1  ORF type:complete len:1076 (+),score=202.77 GILK01006272.1:69-3230(+)